jgi:hypothetical protein
VADLADHQADSRNPDCSNSFVNIVVPEFTLPAKMSLQGARLLSLGQ